MSYLYRPTPVLNPGPPQDVVMSRLPAGTMRGYDGGVNWKAFFDSKRAAMQGSPWIVRSGTMGSFLAAGLGQDVTDTGNLPLTPFDPGNINLSPMLPLPVDLYPMPSPIDPSIVAYNPGGISEAPQIVSAGGSMLSTAASTPFPWSNLITSLTSIGTSIARAATGQPQIAAPAAPVASTLTQPASLVAQAQALQAQANALAASNPALAAQDAARANALLAQAGMAPGGSWFTQSSMISGVPNWVLAGGGAVILLIALGGGGAYAARRR